MLLDTKKGKQYLFPGQKDPLFSLITIPLILYIYSGCKLPFLAEVTSLLVDEPKVCGSVLMARHLLR